jgi:ketosteroid isomerase-like protein
VITNGESDDHQPVGLRDATDAFNARDLDRFADAVADDVAFQGPGGIGGEGKTACVVFYRSLFDAFPGERLEIRDVHVAEDVTVEEGTFSGTHTGMARPGRAVGLDYVLVLRSKDGEQVSMSLMLDRLLILEQLGPIGDGGELL